MLVNVLVVGSGGREHALSWKLQQSDQVTSVYTSPGNGGTVNNVPIEAENIETLAEFALKHDCFTVVGPEKPLAHGIVDKFQAKGLGIFGPTKKAAQLESSKVWAKEFMKRNGIPTATFEIFDDPKKAMDYVDSVSYNVVVKAEGLAAGKGVIVCNSRDEAKAAIDSILVKRKFGDAGTRIIVEERIDGVEASYIALCDGNVALPMASSQDHKRIYDDDKGPNTGGMGAYSPTPVITEAIEKKIQEQIINKTLFGMNEEGIPFSGFLYAGVMIKDNQPYVLEFNVRMGDPECQPIVMRMNFDLYEYLKSASTGKLNQMTAPRWRHDSSVCVVLASNGYPEVYPKGEEITGLTNIPDNTMIFHAGTKRDNSRVLTSGGRVLGITSLGRTISDAISNAYRVVDQVNWPNKYFRSDIGRKALGT